MPVVHRLPTGKVPSEVLSRVVFNMLGVPCERLIQGPNVGEDAAIIDLGDRVLVMATDPITGAEGNIGWLSVHVNANDVASCGARPLWFLSVVLLPEGAAESLLREIMDDMHSALCEIGASLIGGHTETTPGLDRPILIGCMVGEAPRDRYVTTGGAEPGDRIIMTKGAGVEGTGILAQDLADVLKKKVSQETLTKAISFIKQISVVPEAMIAVDVGGVHSLHDPTEGGLLNGLWEMAEAASVGLRVREEAIPIAPETIEVCGALGVDPLKLLGSGTMLIVSEPGKAEEIVGALGEKGIPSSIIGDITPLEEGRYLLKAVGGRVPIENVDQDELYRILDELG